MGIPFHESGYGRRFFDVQLPKLTQALNRLAEATETQNNLLTKVAARETHEDKKSTVFVCCLKRYENKDIKLLGNVSVCETPSKAALWANQTLRELEEKGFMVKPESKLAFFENISSNPGGLLYVYENEDSESKESFFLSVEAV